MIKILYILRMIGFGGTERQVVELCRVMDKSKFDVTVVLFFHSGGCPGHARGIRSSTCPGRGQWPRAPGRWRPASLAFGPRAIERHGGASLDAEGYLSELRASGVRIKILAGKRSYKWLALPRLIAYLRREQFDVVQTFLPIANFLGGLAARYFSRAKVIGCLRNASPFSVTDVFCLMDFVAFRCFCHKVLANSQSVKACAREAYKIKEENIAVIPNGKQFGDFKPRPPSNELKSALQIPEDHFVVVCVGRVTRQKGQRYLVQAVAQLVRQGVRNFSVLLVGKPEETGNRVRELIRENNLESYVKMLGIRNDIPDLLGISHLLVLPSLWEGFPNVLLEAMGSKVPVIATDIPSNSDVVRQHKTGLLVPPQDAEGLSVAIKEFMDHPEERRRLAENAYQDVREKYSWEKVIPEYERLYEDILAND